MALILTQLDVEDVEMEQLAVGALDALLSRKCDADFNRALIPDQFPTHRATYIRH
jgi:hypothetical protein